MDDVGLEFINPTPDRLEGRQWKIKLAIERRIDGPHGNRLFVLWARFVAWLDDLNFIPVLHEYTCQLPESARHSIDLGKVGLGDETDTH